jgi:hypothetical protein
MKDPKFAKGYAEKYAKLSCELAKYKENEQRE